MNQRERIMALVKQGVITTEEALILLENDHKTTTDENKVNYLEKMQEVEKNITSAHSEMDMLESLELIAPLNEQQRNRIKELRDEIHRLQDEREKMGAADIDAEEEQRAKSASNPAGDFVQQMGSILKKTGNHVQNYLKEAVERQKELRTPKPFQKTYDFVGQELSHISIALHTGNIVVKPWDQAHVKIEVEANLYTLEEDLETFFLNNSQLSVNADELIVQIVDKNIAANLTIFLPQTHYHHVTLRTEMGNIEVCELKFEDGYMKTTHGRVHLEKLDGVMLEAYTTNGHIDLINSRIRELVADAVNGKITASGYFMTTQLATTNGDIQLNNESRDIEEMTQETVNGNIDITVKEGLPFALTANTKYGTIQHHLAHIEVVDDEISRAGQVLSANVRYNSSLIPAFILQARSKTGMITIHQKEGEA